MTLMQVIKGLKNLSPAAGNSAVAIGNFDGVHLGHQRILASLVHEANKDALLPTVLTFSPHPEKAFGKSEIKMIQTLEQRLADIEKFNIQTTIVIGFDKKFSNLSSQEFIKRILVMALNTKKIIVGENFHFGKNREGTVTTLKETAAKFHFLVRSIPPVSVGNSLVSSSIVRRLLEEGKVEEANAFLGRPYEIAGCVVKGKSRGKDLGFPTANIQTSNEILPRGVFVSKVMIKNKMYPSLTHVGGSPTFQDAGTNIETYIVDFTADLYAESIRLFLIKKLRDEKRFVSPEALSEQIEKDLAEARHYFH
jgi:riboflavin kinase/FMN adenylyltransferase